VLIIGLIFFAKLGIISIQTRKNRKKVDFEKISGKKKQKVGYGM